MQTELTISTLPQFLESYKYLHDALLVKTEIQGEIVINESGERTWVNTIELKLKIVSSEDWPTYLRLKFIEVRSFTIHREDRIAIDLVLNARLAFIDDYVCFAINPPNDDPETIEDFQFDQPWTQRAAFFIQSKRCYWEQIGS